MGLLYCNFFQCVCNKDQLYYFDWEHRQSILSGNLDADSADSHTSIARYYRLKCGDEDALGQYEYNPLTGIFTVDLTAGKEIDDFAYKEIKKLDWNDICEPLIIKNIINPFALPKREPGKKDLRRLVKWASIWDSCVPVIRRAIRDNISDGVWTSIRNPIEEPVTGTIMYGIGFPYWESMSRAIDAYTSTFFTFQYDLDFSPLVKLWEQGLFPMRDNDFWYLLSGEWSDVVWKGKIGELDDL